MEGLPIQDGQSFVAGGDEANRAVELTPELARAYLDEIMPTESHGGVQMYRDAFYAVTHGSATPEQKQMVGFADRCMNVLNSPHDRSPESLEA